jgi:hypothetical protein
MCRVIFNLDRGCERNCEKYIFNEKAITKAKEKRAQGKQKLTCKELTA